MEHRRPRRRCNVRAGSVAAEAAVLAAQRRAGRRGESGSHRRRRQRRRSRVRQQGSDDRGERQLREARADDRVRGRRAQRQSRQDPHEGHGGIRWRFADTRRRGPLGEPAMAAARCSSGAQRDRRRNVARSNAVRLHHDGARRRPESPACARLGKRRALQGATHGFAVRREGLRRRGERERAVAVRSTSRRGSSRRTPTTSIRSS